jgi:hypothetical protein
VDIAVARDFPKSEYMEVEQRISVYLSGLGVDAGTVPGFSGYAGGWNALIIRFRAADEDCSAAALPLARNFGGMPLEDRYNGERALFGFFANAMSTVESCCFAIYQMARMKNPAAFNAEERSVKVESTADAVAAAFPGTTLASDLAQLVQDPIWARVKYIRNTLVHRESPGITIYINTVGAPPAPPAEWTGRGVVLEPALVNDPMSWLGREITTLVGATLGWVKSNF